MLHPPISELIKKVDCRYTLVVATAKRARQLVDGEEKLIEYESENPVSTAIMEILNDRVKYERKAKVQKEIK